MYGAKVLTGKTNVMLNWFKYTFSFLIVNHECERHASDGQRKSEDGWFHALWFRIIGSSKDSLIWYSIFISTSASRQNTLWNTCHHWQCGVVVPGLWNHDPKSWRQSPIVSYGRRDFLMTKSVRKTFPSRALSLKFPSLTICRQKPRSVPSQWWATPPQCPSLSKYQDYI